ncbi:MAG TPA: hypothetical protein VMR14_12010 [Streptosporangiaceae bacterium]|nr:hypothetical protein [Streptosporangiaceae bacterium]
MVSRITGTIRPHSRRRRLAPGRRIARAWVTLAVTAGGLLVTAQAAQASWLQLTTPTVAGASTWEFTAVSCSSPNICMAVGNSSGGTDQLLAEQRTKAGWTVQPVPQPAEGSSLSGIWCGSASECIAVGQSPTSGGSVPLAESWNGGTWQILVTPQPAGDPASELSAVSCTSAAKCTAVGSATKGNREAPLAERWNGAKWQIQATRKPAGAADGVLGGVSCTSATRCIAVGDGSTGTHAKALAEVWNGAKWAIAPTPDLPSGFTQLSAVSCPSSNSCMATGLGVAERWNGAKWSLVKIGKPGGTEADLSSVSCTRAGPCYAAGANFVEGVQMLVAEYWNGSRWQVQGAQVTTSYDSSGLSGVSCTTATNCTTVGFYHDPVDGDRALAFDFSLRWQDQSPLPFNGVVSTGLNAVSCASPQACVAIGTFQTATAFESFAETWSGGTWSSESTPKPKVTNLAAVSCTAATSCTAVGDIVTNGIPLTLAEHWNGITWARQHTPNPAKAARSFLTAVSCPSRGACTAVGFYVDHAGHQFTIAERWNGRSWEAEHVPGPAGKAGIQLEGVSCGSARACSAVGTFDGGMFTDSWNGKNWRLKPVAAPKGGKEGFLSSVSCTSASACTAVGDYLHGSRLVPLSERWNGKNWQAQRAAIPPGASSSGLSSVSCTSATACTAAGFTQHATTGTVAERWNGKKWVAEIIQPPPGSLSAQLGSLSCNSAIACMAVGSYQDNTDTEQMLAEQYS